MEFSFQVLVFVSLLTKDPISCELFSPSSFFQDKALLEILTRYTRRYNQFFTDDEATFILDHVACGWSNTYVLWFFEMIFPEHDWPRFVERLTGISYVMATRKAEPIQF